MQLYKYDSKVAVNIVTWYLYNYDKIIVTWHLYDIIFLLLGDCVDTFGLHHFIKPYNLDGILLKSWNMQKGESVHLWSIMAINE